MSLQVLGLRAFDDERGERKTYDAFFDKGWKIETLEQALAAFPLPEIPQNERWNLFYTVAHCGAGKREFAWTDTVAFDLDGVPDAQREQAASLACAALGLDPARTAVIGSGGGVHLLVRLAERVTDKKWFAENKLAYGECCRRIEAALKGVGILAKADPTIFEPRRILRLPFTTNRKVGKPERPCIVLQPGLAPQGFDLAAFSPTGKLDKDSALPKHALKKFAKTDTPAVLAGCAFLKHAKENASLVNEPQWYAALSVVGRLTDHGGKTARDFCHELSSGHPGYSVEETDRKIDQATGASGPRLCANIDALWGKCRECPHFEKVVSPIQIVAEGTIPTEHTGFHRIAGNGKSIPEPHDLRRFFEREKHFRTVEKSRVVYTWNGQHYRETPNNVLEAYALERFRPEVKSGVLKEFRDVVTASRIVQTEWFAESTKGYVAFENGVLRVKDGVFEPHDPSRGFRSVLPFNFDPKARAPLFGKMLSRITQEDEKLTAILLEYMGYIVSGDDLWIHKALVLEGDGSNGKSTLIQVIQDLVGKGAYCSVSLKSLDDEYARARFDGKLLNITDETPSRSLVDSSYFKAMSAGGSVDARSPYQEPFTMTNRAKFVFSCHELPRTQDSSYGLIRRFVIVPFNATITRETTPDFDPHLGKKLKAELPGIFNLALDGYRRLVRQGGFTEAEASLARAKAYEATTNPVKTWFADEVAILTNGSSTAFTPLAELYDAYKAWAKAREYFPVIYDKFCKDLTRIVPDYARRQERRRWPEGGRDRNPKRGLVGIGLVAEHGEQHEDISAVAAAVAPPTPAKAGASAKDDPTEFLI